MTTAFNSAQKWTDTEVGREEKKETGFKIVPT
jgi:hypothetical protein